MPFRPEPCRSSWRRGAGEDHFLEDDLQHGDERHRDQGALPAEEYGAGQHRKQREEGIHVQRPSLRARRDHIGLEVLDHVRRKEREAEGHPAAAEGGHDQERDACDPDADLGDQLPERDDHGQRDGERDTKHP